MPSWVSYHIQSSESEKFSHNWKFNFGRKHGAVLIMINPVLKRFPRNGNLKPLLKIVEGQLQGTVLVTETVTCPAYAQIVSRGRGQSATIGVSVSLPTLSPNFSTGAKISWSWRSTARPWTVGSEPGCTYMPLMELSMLKKWWRLWSNEPTTQRTSVGLEDMDTPFVPYLPPWGLLDDEGGGCRSGQHN